MPSHPTRASPRIFLSYARSDRDFAVALRDELEAAGLAVWHDLKDLEAGQWWSQIAGALEAKSIEHIVLIATPAALASQPVADEIWFAQREGKSACLVLPRHLGGTLGRSRLPRWLRAEEHFNFAEEGRKTALLDALAKPGQGPRRPRPEGRPKAADYVARAKEYGQIRAALLDTEGEATTATVVLTGPGGFGKTTLATAFINDEAVQQAYFNGILLVELGEGLAKLPKTYDGRKQLEGLIKVKVEALIKTLEGEAQVFDELDAAKVRLKEILDKRHGAVLLWIDDAWDAGHAQHFIDAAPDAAKLVTTRVRDLLPEAAARIDVDELTDAEAATFMGSELNPVSDPERTGLRELATITAGRWPILIRQINAQLRYQTADQANHKAQGLADAIASLRKRLKREGLDDLDKSTDANRATAVRLSVGVSFELLVEEDRHRKYPDGFHEARYLDLAGFQEAEVPVATIARLWAHLGVLRRAEAPTLDARDESKRADQEKHWRAELREESVAILERLYSLALLQKLDASDDDGMVRLHDVMRQYLADKQKEAIKAFHEQFVLAYDADTGETVSDMTERERRYFYTWFPTHLDKAGERAALDALLLDPQWMRRKLDALDSPLPLISDYERLGQGRVQSLIGRTLRLTSGILSRDGRQLLPQLLGRFKAAETAGIPNFIRNARTRIVAPAIVPVRCSLTSAGAETARLEGHCHTVSALQLLADGRLASASADGTIRLWNIEHQSEVARLAKYNQVTALATLKDGTLVYGCDDQGMFQIASNRSHGKLVATQISIAAGSVTALAVLPDGRIAAGNSKGEIWLCGSDGQIDFMLPKVHSELIFLLTALPDGRLVSASGEGPMQIWDVPLKQVVQTIGEEGETTMIPLSADKIATAGADGIIRIRDLRGSGIKQANLIGHSDFINSLLPLPGQCFASSSDDGTIRVWDSRECREVSCLAGHVGSVYPLILLADGRLASGGSDGAIRIWDYAAHPNSKLDSHDGWVTALCSIGEELIASGGTDGIIKLWDVRTGTAKASVDSNAGVVVSLATQPTGQIVSADLNGSINIWDLTSGAESILLAKKWKVPGADDEGKWISALASLPDGRLAYGTEDGKTGVIDLARNDETRLPTGLARIDAIAFLRPQSLIVGAPKKLLFYDLDAINCLFVLENLYLGGRVATNLPNGNIAFVSYNGRVAVWNQQDRRLVCLMRGQTDLYFEQAFCVLPSGRLVSGGSDKVIRLWSVQDCKQIAQIEIDAPVLCLAVALQGSVVVAGDELGRLHWLEIVE